MGFNVVSESKDTKNKLNGGKDTQAPDTWDTDNEEEKTLKKKKKNSSLFDLKSITKKASDAPLVKNTPDTNGEDCNIQ